MKLTDKQKRMLGELIRVDFEIVHDIIHTNDFVEVKGEQGGDVYRLRYYPQHDGSFECYEK